ncbi:MAG: phosphoribosylamine--glycine ligase [Armatimonadetes bacterium]|nr:phosphoribosylamine--glycine ligase [Armatimonadota bacterium]
MKVLIVGSGGREHALAWKISQSPLLTKLYCAPGNAGIQRLAECVGLPADDVSSLVSFAEEQRIDLTVVGPEHPLILGLADALRARGLPVYGPSAAAAQLEGSKIFTDELLARHGISRKRFAAFSDPDAAIAFAREFGAPLVVKADGEALGKGVKVCSSVSEAEGFIRRCMVDREFGAAGERVVIEECLAGQECSIKAFTDGTTVLPMVPSQDHKRIGEGDTGDNTGGMGCYSPVPAVDDSLFSSIVERFLVPTVSAMKAEGIPYSGTLYGGMILTEAGPEILEYNCRFGDPETQVVLPRLDSDLLEVLLATAEGRLGEVQVQWSNRAAVVVVIASGGYPGPYEKGKRITGLEEAARVEGVEVFHAGTTEVNGEVYTAGGRVLGVTAVGAGFREARERAYEACLRIHFDDMYYRRDIGWRALEG